MGKSFRLVETLRVATRALQSGLADRAGMSEHRLRWFVDGRSPGPHMADAAPRGNQCRHPVMLEHTGRVPDKGAVRLGYGGRSSTSGRIFTVEIYARCRVCEACLRARRNSWTYRAMTETRDSARTWFATFTLAPAEHMVMLSRARARFDAQRVNFEALSEVEKFREVHAEISKEFTLYFKRLRERLARKYGERVPLRYVLVAEAHKSGLPHYHALVHEGDFRRPVPKRMLESEWKLGFTRFKLVEHNDPRVGWYVCKYLAKDARARVRASIRYGEACVPPSLDVRSNTIDGETGLPGNRRVREAASGRVPGLSSRSPIVEGNDPLKPVKSCGTCEAYRDCPVKVGYGASTTQGIPYYLPWGWCVDEPSRLSRPGSDACHPASASE